MDKNKNILILNSGGTFNKFYDPITGKLDVVQNNRYIKKIFNRSKIDNIDINGILYKDSLDINNDDRKKIVDFIATKKYKKIIIIHGTDTMDKTAEYLAKYFLDKTIILTGAMVPFSIDEIEATSNLMLALGYIKATSQNGVFIAMHGLVESFKKIKKDRSKGIFICQ